MGGMFHLFHKNNVSVITAEHFTLDDQPVFVLYLNIIKYLNQTNHASFTWNLMGIDNICGVTIKITLLLDFYVSDERKNICSLI